MFAKILLIVNLILASLLLFGTWYIRSQLTQIKHASINDRPDSFATKVTIYHTDAHGELYDQLTAPLSIHNSFKNITTFLTPQFILYLKNNETWQLSSCYGILQETKDFLQLRNNVMLDQKQFGDIKPTLSLRTHSLDIDLKKKIAQTSAPVTIRQTSQKVHAIGLHADFNTKAIQLLSRVTAEINPPNP